VATLDRSRSWRRVVMRRRRANTNRYHPSWYPWRAAMWYRGDGDPDVLSLRLFLWLDLLRRSFFA